MKTRERNKLIKMLKGIVDEIKRHNMVYDNNKFFMCCDSNYKDLIKEYITEIAKFGKENLDEFIYDYAFLYGAEKKAVEYNECKINHLEMYIEHLESIN